MGCSERQRLQPVDLCPLQFPIVDTEITKFQVITLDRNLSVGTLQIIRLANQATGSSTLTTAMEKLSHHRRKSLYYMQVYHVEGRTTVLHTTNAKIIDHSGLVPLDERKPTRHRGTVFQLMQLKGAFSPALVELLTCLLQKLLIKLIATSWYCHLQDVLISPLWLLLQLTQSHETRHVLLFEDVALLNVTS